MRPSFMAWRAISFAPKASTYQAIAAGASFTTRRGTSVVFFMPASLPRDVGRGIVRIGQTGQSATWLRIPGAAGRYAVGDIAANERKSWIKCA